MHDIVVGQWWHSLDHDEPCRVVDTEVLWSQSTCVIGVPRRGTTLRALQSRLAPVKPSDAALLDQLCFTSTTARNADAIEMDALVAPLQRPIADSATHLER